MSECEKVNCSYCYRDKNDEYARCHFEGYWMAPCEYEDNYEEEN